MNKRKVAVLFMPLTVIFSCGCASFNRGYLNEAPQVSSERVTCVDSVGEVTYSPSVQNDKVALTVYAPSKLSHKMVATTITRRGQKMLTVGFFPGLPAYRSIGEGGSLIGWTITTTVLNLGLWGPLFNWPYEPFASYKKPESNVGGSPGSMAKFAAVAWFGLYKWLTPAPPEWTTTERVIQAGIEKPLPLDNVLVECEIPAASYRDTMRTDARGQTVFDLPVSPSRRTDVSFSLRDVAQNQHAYKITDQVGKKQTFGLSFSGGTDSSSIISRTTALPRPTWATEPVAVMSITANSVPVTESGALTEWFHNSLAETKYFKLVSRSDMSMILKEQRFQRSDNCDDTQCLVEVGKLLAVGRMIGGSIAKVGQLYVFTSRMLDVETGEVICSAKGSINGDSEKLLAMIGEVAEELCAEYGKLKQRK
jgi:hypothetical protein